MSQQLDSVSIYKKPNIHFNGRSISYLVEFKDGSKKTLGVLLPTEKPLTFETHIPERIEIISGKCLIRIGDGEFKTLVEGEILNIPENCRFSMQSSEVVDYICHLEL